MPVNRAYQISDDGEAYEVALFSDGVQVGAVLFPVEGSGMAEGLAKEVATSWMAGTG